MVDKNKTWNLILETFTALAQNVGPTIQNVVKEEGVAEIAGWGHTFLATSISPEPVTVERIRVRGAYNAPGRIETHLDGLADAGFFDAKDDGYHITDKTQSFVDRILEEQREHLLKLPMLNAEDMKKLVDLLAISYNNAKASEEHTPCLDDASTRGVPDDLSPLEKFVRYASYLNAFRDDSHLNAWHSFEVTGHEWETFSHVWRETPLPEGLLTARGYDEDEHQQALDSLVERGWIEPQEGDIPYKVTAQGKVLREGAEDATDNMFFAPWEPLQADDWDTLNTLLIQQRDLLQDLLQPAEG